MYIPRPKNTRPKLTTVQVLEDGESWCVADYTRELVVDLRGLSNLEDGYKPHQLENFFILDKESMFLYEIISKQQALWIWDHFKQAGEPELVELNHGPFNKYVDSKIMDRNQIENSEADYLAIAVGFYNELEELTDGKS